VHTPLAVDVAWRGRTAILRPRGAIDLSCATRLAASVDEVVVAGARELEIDLSGLRFIDSSGIGVLRDAHQTFGGAIRMWGASGLVARVLEVAAAAPALNAEDRRLTWAFATIAAPTGTLSN
jgi:anti-anti-sigma factor